MGIVPDGTGPSGQGPLRAPGASPPASLRNGDEGCSSQARWGRGRAWLPAPQALPAGPPAGPSACCLRPTSSPSDSEPLQAPPLGSGRPAVFPTPSPQLAACPVSPPTPGTPHPHLPLPRLLRASRASGSKPPPLAPLGVPRLPETALEDSRPWGGQPQNLANRCGRPIPPTRPKAGPLEDRDLYSPVESSGASMGWARWALARCSCSPGSAHAGGRQCQPG